MSTANFYSATQPGGFAYGIQASNPVATDVAYRRPASQFGSNKDPMVGHAIGGINVFGGGLALYDHTGKLLGGIGVSGDSSCADHNIAWKLRHKLGLDYLPVGVSPTKDDNIVYDIKNGVSAGGWGHPVCAPKATEIAGTLPVSNPIGVKKP